MPTSKLLISNLKSADDVAAVTDRFLRNNIDARRLITRPTTDVVEYMQTHQGVDIVLDAFPYSGGTISCYALFMGVPVVTLAGNHPAHRAGVSALARAEALEWVATNEEEYVGIAVELADNLDELERTRTSLRERFLSSRWNNSQIIVREIEAAYRDVWRRWCARH